MMCPGLIFDRHDSLATINANHEKNKHGGILSAAWALGWLLLHSEFNKGATVLGELHAGSFISFSGKVFVKTKSAKQMKTSKV